MTEVRTTPTSEGRAGPGFDRRLLPPMMLGSILNPVNSSIMAVALVPIGRALGAPASQTTWLVSALYLATALGQPVVGRLIDLFGPRRLFLISTSLVGVAGVIGVLAPNLGVLIAARVLLGFGTCAGYPSAMALLRSEAERTGKDSPAGVLTALAVANQTIAVIGPLLGGMLISVGGWRATFAVNVPLALAAALLGLWRLPRRAGSGEAPRRGRIAARLDLPGMGLFAGMLVALVFGLPQGLNTLALQNCVYFQADPDRVASSAGLLRTFAYVGSMAASSATAASFGHSADTSGMHHLAWIMLGAGVLYLLLNLFDRTLGRLATPA
ncbi:MFS transporter [Streptomyces sp. NPDC094153]|uniref:MFS transporter n=1 Tax=Streptomyces sp. NPDC094153 TaxID=3366058 RepID=UPI003818804D